MAKPPVHTVPHEGCWANRREGSSRVTKTFDTKAEAQAAGRETARREKTEHLIHNKDGSIRYTQQRRQRPIPATGACGIAPRSSAALGEACLSHYECEGRVLANAVPMRVDLSAPPEHVPLLPGWFEGAEGSTFGWR